MSKGFMLYGVWLSQHQSLPIEHNMKSMEETWVHLGFSTACIHIMMRHPRKVLWPSLTTYILTQVEEVRLRVLELLSLLDVNYDPGQEMASLTEEICTRPTLTKFLLTKKEIKHSPKSLLHILTKLKSIPIE